jgi:drug/metabolite transporter (DMT)-like permease
MSGPRGRLLFAFATLYLVWGSSYLFIKFAVTTMPPLGMAGARFIIAGLVLFAAMRALGTPTPGRAEWRAGTVVGVALMCSNAAVAWSERRIDSGVASLIVSMTPCWMVLIDARRRRVRPHRGVLFGLALGFAGIAALVGPAELVGHGHVDSVGAAVVLAGTVSWAMGSLYAQRAQRPQSAFMTSGIQMLTGGAVLFAVAVLAGEWRGFELAQVSTRSWMAFAYLIALPSLAGFTSYLYILAHASPARASTYAYMNPLVAVTLGALFGGETLAPRVLIATAIIVAAVALIVSFGSAGRPAARATVTPAPERP